jgi:hypothetical protein
VTPWNPAMAAIIARACPGMTQQAAQRPRARRIASRRSRSAASVSVGS